MNAIKWILSRISLPPVLIPLRAVRTPAIRATHLIAIFCYLIIGNWLLQPVGAASMDSSNFKIQGGNVNIGGSEESSENYNLSTTLGQLAAQEFQEKGYIVKAGFQYIHSIIPFEFTVYDTDVKIGEIIPQIPQTAITTLTVSFGGAGSYQVTASEDSPLQTQTGKFIKNTSCDGGKNSCSPSLAKFWTSKTSYGFGYNMSGEDVPSDFINTNYFRPFPDKSKKEEPTVVMGSENVVKKHKATVTFKVNVPQEQDPGSYQTVVNFIATPSF